MARQLSNSLFVQRGKQTVLGTGVTPTVKVMHLQDFKISPDDKIESIPSMQGLAPSYGSLKLNRQVGLQLTEILSFSEIGYSFDGLLGIATPVGAGPTYSRDYDAPTDTQVTPRIDTFYHGTATAGYNVIGAMPTSLDMSFGVGELNKSQTSYVGLKTEKDETPTSLADRVITVTGGHQVSLYIDAWGGTIGTTLIDCTVYSASLKLQTNRQLDWSLGSLEACEHFHTTVSGSLSLELAYPGDSNISDDLLEEAVTNDSVAKRLFQIVVGDGTSSLTLKYAGIIQKNPTIFESRNGVTVVKLELAPEYNTTLGNWFLATLVNTVAAYT